MNIKKNIVLFVITILVVSFGLFSTMAFYPTQVEASWLSHTIDQAEDDLRNLNNDIEEDTGINVSHYVPVPVPTPIGPVLIPVHVGSDSPYAVDNNDDTNTNIINTTSGGGGDFSCSGTLTLGQAREAKDNGSIKTSVYVQGNTAYANIENHTGCSLPVTLQAWKIYDNTLTNQRRFDSTSFTVAGNTTVTINTDLPECMAQVDLYYGSVRSTPVDDSDYLLGWTYYQTNGAGYGEATGNFCRDIPPPDSLAGSCSVTPSSVNVNGTLNWSATATGGAGSYIYSWSGTDSLIGNSNSVSKVYGSAGTKTGSVVITSGSQSVTRTCSAVVNNIPVDNDLSISCSASPSSVDVDEDVDWSANPSGGTGSYSYDWSGTDGLDGSSRYITWSYDDNGTKHATVTVTSGGQTASASCTVRVDEEDYDNLNVSCYASPANPQIGTQMRWYANVDGGDGDYDYEWEGTNGLDSSSRYPYMTYNTPGSKRATVTVTDGEGEEDTATCYANINSVLAFSQVNQQPLVDAVYLSQVPYTGFADNMKLYFFVGMLALFSAWVAYIIIEKKKEMGELN